MITLPPPTRVEHVMGTAVVFDVRDHEFNHDYLEEAASMLHWVDATFSVFRHDSEISRIARGELSVTDADLQVQVVLAICEALRRDTKGAFDHRPDGTLDPSGYVKGWAVEQAVRILTGSGIDSFVVSAGGDIAVRGTPSNVGVWRTGIRDPPYPNATLGTVELDNNAIATSGLYERGPHIWGTGDLNEGLASVSIVGPDLGIADALATAVFAGGLEDIAWLNSFPGYDLIAVTSDRRILRSPSTAFTSSAVSTQ